MRHRLHLFLAAVSLVGIVAILPIPAQGQTYAAGGSAEASWSGGWPTLDLRGRLGFLISGGHEVGLSAGFSSMRLASQVLYVVQYSHTWLVGRIWPLVSLYGGGATDLVGILGQTRALLGMAFGARLPVSQRVALRFELGHELLIGPEPADRTVFTLGLEYLGGPGWAQNR